jgi:Uma2 family endonuclease
MPTHLELPDSDGKPIDNIYQPGKYELLNAVCPVLDQLHSGGQYLTAANAGIYWQFTDPPWDGCKAPDCFYVPNVPPMLDGVRRRSYVLWQELIAPTLIIELVSGDGREERDATPMKGKFWVSERAIRAANYLIFDPETGESEKFTLEGNRYRRVRADAKGRLAMPPMGVEVGSR